MKKGDIFKVKEMPGGNYKLVEGVSDENTIELMSVPGCGCDGCFFYDDKYSTCKSSGEDRIDCWNGVFFVKNISVLKDMSESVAGFCNYLRDNYREDLDSDMLLSTYLRGLENISRKLADLSRYR